ncbi:Hypothetical protein, putative [Bodo saltans]|uniref:Uncharacterized protein n=1 Tax=Bodo saltans TaxID=75058 RepID=A0A0S4JAD0_BODSA|nr:Hypothetical protein, putative [Bodo saltans]|eukprot:CUG87290.1 Hypothetical protein, putative [Bodo saltans]
MKLQKIFTTFQVSRFSFSPTHQCGVIPDSCMMQHYSQPDATQQLLDDIQQDMYGHVIAPISLHSSSSGDSSESSSRDASLPRVIDVPEGGHNDTASHATTECVDVLPNLRAGDGSSETALLTTSSRGYRASSVAPQPSSSSSGSRVVCTPEDQLVVIATQLPTSLVYTNSSSSTSTSSSRPSHATSSMTTQCSSSPSPVLAQQGVGGAVQTSCLVAPSSTTSEAKGITITRKRVRVVSPAHSDEDECTNRRHTADRTVDPVATVAASSTASSNMWFPPNLCLSQLDYNAGGGGSSEDDDDDDRCDPTLTGGKEADGIASSSAEGLHESTPRSSLFYDVHPASIRYYLPLRESRMIPLPTLPMASLVSLRAVD